MLIETKEIGFLVTDSPFQMDRLHEDSVIDLDMCIGQARVMVNMGGNIETLDVPKDCRFIRPVLVDGKWELWPDDREALIRHFGKG